MVLKLQMTILCIRERISYLNCVEELTWIKALSSFSLLSLVSPINLNIISKDEYTVFYFRSPFMEG